MGLRDICSLRDVADIVADLEAVLGKQFPCRLQVLRAARQDRDLGAGVGKLPRDGEANALAAAGDDGDSGLSS